MNIHEYQGKEILRSYGIPIPRGKVVFTVDEAIQTANELDSKITVIKAQIHAGGRGKAGGIKIVKNLDDINKNVEQLLGKTLKTNQTMLAGKRVNKLLIEEGLNIKKEYYIGLTIDRAINKVVIISSDEGGIDVEELAKKFPNKIYKEVIDPAIGLMPFQARRIAFSLNIQSNLVNRFVDILMNLYQIYIDKDCSLIEINPFVLTDNENLIALDAKFNFDENALFRHPEIKKFRDIDEEDSEELDALEFGLSYIALEGNIGCMVNGAGLAMATMDIIKYYGGEPANFLDVGGGATIEKVTEAFRILISNKRVSGVFVNIFGGIMRCDVIATGIVSAVKETKLELPLVVRLEGTNIEIGKDILQKSNLNIYVVDSMSEGAKRIIELVKNKRMDI